MNLQKAAMSARLAKLPRDLPPPTSVEPLDDEDEEDEESEARDAIGSLSITHRSNANRGHNSSTQATTERNPAFAPLSASTHFEQAIQVAVPASDLDFRVYITPPAPPASDESTGSILVCHHGAGYSALSFACLAKAITTTTNGECGVMAFDARAHGKTTSLSNPGHDPVTLDLTLGRLSNDLIELIATTFPNPKAAPAIILVGHSMGGAVMTHSIAAITGKGYHVGGVAVLDVVEGSALEALPYMNQLLESRPSAFPSQEKAVEWHVTGQSGSTIHNIYSARLSVPSLVVPSTAEEVDGGLAAWKWRTPLKSTAPFWEGWFTGLSKAFLAARTARLLILAGTDRLDRELMIGQMQGKFQLQVVPNVGHMLHEDDPEKIAQILVEFWRRNERLLLPNIKKVGEL